MAPSFARAFESCRPFKSCAAAVAGLLGLLIVPGQPATAVAQEEDRPKTERRGREPQPTSTVFWSNGGVGWGAASLTTFHAEQREGSSAITAGLVPTRASGPAADLGVGVRLSVVTLGARGGVMALQGEAPPGGSSSMTLWSIDGELGFRIPLGRVEPYLTLAGGYSTFGGFGDALSGVGRGTDIDGANLRAGLGVDWFVARHFSLGARATAEALFLSRSGVPLRDLAQPREVGTVSEAKARVLEGNGTSMGSAYALMIGPGVHF